MGDFWGIPAMTSLTERSVLTYIKSKDFHFDEKQIEKVSDDHIDKKLILGSGQKWKSVQWILRPIHLYMFFELDLYSILNWIFSPIRTGFLLPV